MGSPDDDVLPELYTDLEELLPAGFTRITLVSSLTQEQEFNPVVFKQNCPRAEDKRPIVFSSLLGVNL